MPARKTSIEVPQINLRIPYYVFKKHGEQMALHYDPKYYDLKDEASLEIDLDGLHGCAQTVGVNIQSAIDIADANMPALPHAF